jgi:hypothetical protein
MSPTAPTPSKSPQNTNSKAAAEPTKPPAEQTTKAPEAPVAMAPLVDTRPTEAPAADAQAAVVTEAAGRPDSRTILSLTVPEKLARQIRLLARVEGVTISQLVLESVEKTVPARLKAALAAIVED